MQLKFHLLCCALSQTSRQIVDVSVLLNLSVTFEGRWNEIAAGAA
jgi:hypothetical protein